MKRWTLPAMTRSSQPGLRWMSALVLVPAALFGCSDGDPETAEVSTTLPVEPAPDIDVESADEGPLVATSTGGTVPPIGVPESMAVRELLLDHGGLGPVRLGMTLLETETALGVEVLLDTQAGCDVLRPAEPGVIFYADDQGNVSGVFASTPSYYRPDSGDSLFMNVVTAAGVAFGVTRDQVEAAYPGQVQDKPYAEPESPPSEEYFNLIVPSGPGSDDYVIWFGFHHGELAWLTLLPFDEITGERCA